MHKSQLILSFLTTCLSVVYAQNYSQYSLCPDTSEWRHFVITNYTGVFHNDTETYNFTLSTDFSNYTAVCQGVTSDEWLDCPAEFPYLETKFQQLINNKIKVIHTYQCYKGEGTPDYDAITTPVVNGEEYIDTIQVDLDDGSGGKVRHQTHPRVAFDVYFEIPHARPNPRCREASLHNPYWTVANLDYTAGVFYNGWTGSGTLAMVHFDLENSANGFRVYCLASNSTMGYYDINITTNWIDPNAWTPCPSDIITDLKPPEVYPSTAFRFETETKKITVKQSWKCDGEDREQYVHAFIILLLTCPLTLWFFTWVATGRYT
jgi:hypothetical protein